MRNGQTFRQSRFNVECEDNSAKKIQKQEETTLHHL